LVGDQLMAEETEQYRPGELRAAIDQLLVALRLEIGGIRRTTAAIDPVALDKIEVIVSEIERKLRTLPLPPLANDPARN
jgi:enolase